MHDLEAKVESKHIYNAFAEMQKKDYARAEEHLSEGITLAKAEDDEALLALLYSAFGVLCKLKGDFREAWKHYDQAEKLLPDNAVLKLISARLLIEVFSQYDIAIRKMKKVEEMGLDDALVAHQVDAITGLAYAKKGNKTKAKEFLDKLLAAGFDGLVSAGNIDFKLVEACVRKGWHRSVCDQYLAKALDFAKKTGEDPYIRVFERLLAAAREESTQVL